MRTWFFSDTHSMERKLVVPDVDMAIFCGDAGTYKDPIRNQKGVLDFIEWFEELPIKHKIFIAGNHDTSIEAGYVRPKELCKSCVYLEHESVQIEGFKIFGSPWTPVFYDWAFNAIQEQLVNLWNEIPEDTDIVITHGPAGGIMDRCSRDGYRAGCGELYSRLRTIQPKVHAFGHIHENTGIQKMGNTKFINCAVVDDNYKLTNNGIILDI